ncbi:MAG: hypothetical protein KDD94_04805 [Calditrichaeota bacterium]|nr:hypothetical protein [Calditrichota bacterium]
MYVVISIILIWLPFLVLVKTKTIGFLFITELPVVGICLALANLIWLQLTIRISPESYHRKQIQMLMFFCLLVPFTAGSTEFSGGGFIFLKHNLAMAIIHWLNAILLFFLQRKFPIERTERSLV